MMVTCFDDHKLVMKHTFGSLVPGGWVEYQDGIFDISWRDGAEYDVMLKWAALCKEGARRLGKFNTWTTFAKKGRK